MASKVKPLTKVESIFENNSHPQFFIKLIVEKALSDEEIKIWYNIVKNNLPSGIISSVMVPRKNKGLSPATLIKKSIDFNTTAMLQNSFRIYT